MKNLLKTKWLKLFCLSLLISSTATIAHAQRTSTTTTDFAKNSNAAPGTLNGSVRVVDNRGTVKYLQTANGLTTITNTTADKTTTTWQLGGTLTDNTYIDVDGHVFGLDKISLVDITAAGSAASTDATDLSVHGAGTGWTLLVRDELTGTIKKLKAADLLTSGQQVFDVTTDGQTAYALTGLAASPAASKLWVYRNGVKLVGGTDYSISTDGATVTLIPSTIVPNDWSVSIGDVIEIQYVK